MIIPESEMRRRGLGERAPAAMRRPAEGPLGRELLLGRLEAREQPRRAIADERPDARR
jgi:hypothetical protein